MQATSQPSMSKHLLKPLCCASFTLSPSFFCEKRSMAVWRLVVGVYACPSGPTPVHLLQLRGAYGPHSHTHSTHTKEQLKTPPRPLLLLGRTTHPGVHFLPPSRQDDSVLCPPVLPVIACGSAAMGQAQFRTNNFSDFSHNKFSSIQ